MKRIARISLFVAVHAALTAFFVVAGCEQPEPERVGRKFWAVTYDVYCSKKHTLGDAQEVGLAAGCLHPGPPGLPMGSVTFPDGTPYPGDANLGWNTCDACSAIEKVRAAWGEADASVPLMDDPNPPVAETATYVIDGALWAVDADKVAWKMVAGVMVQEAKEPASWPVK